METRRPLEESRLAELTETIAALLHQLDGNEGAASVPRADTLEWVLSLQNAVWLLAHELKVEHLLPERLLPLHTSSAELRAHPFVSHARLLHQAAERMVNAHRKSRNSRPLTAAQSRW